MNNNYYQNPLFSDELINNTLNKDFFQDINQNNFNKINIDNSYILNILKLNKGKKIKAYINDSNTKELNNNFDGIIELTGKDYIIISNPINGQWYLIPITNLNYIIFEEKINFTKDFS